MKMKMEVRKPTDKDKKEAEGWGIWEKEPSEFPWEYEIKETCLILEGSAEVVSDDGKSISFGPGDLVVFREGLKCRWKIKEKIKKRYKFG
jgi:uncharacterized cupin superfamily protein